LPCLDFRKESATIKSALGYMTQKFSFYEEPEHPGELRFIARLYELPGRNGGR